MVYASVQGIWCGSELEVGDVDDEPVGFQMLPSTTLSVRDD